MEEVFQRLEMIKNAIMLEDEDIIDLQVIKLSKLTLDADARGILALLQSGSFEAVIRLIDDYQKSRMGLVSYDDKEVYGLRLELKMLETEYEELSIQKISIESMLSDFNNQYYHHCGKLIESILLYRAKHQQTHADANPEDQNKANAFNDAQKDYDDFQQEYKEKIEAPLVELSDADQKELKSAYRKASKLCHPDKVSDDSKEQAGEVFKQLNDAYRAKNLEMVNDVLAALLSQKGFNIFSDTVSNVDKLRLRISKIKEKIATIQDEIAIIKGDETYHLIEVIDDWEAYFNDMKINLKNELIKFEEMHPES